MPPEKMCAGLSSPQSLEQGRARLTWEICFFWTCSKVRHWGRFSVAPENASNLPQRAGQEPDGCAYSQTLAQGFCSQLPWELQSSWHCSPGPGGHGTHRSRRTGAPACLQCWLQPGSKVKWALLVTLLRLLWEGLSWLLLSWSKSSLPVFGSCSAVPHGTPCSANVTAHTVTP